MDNEQAESTPVLMTAMHAHLQAIAKRPLDAAMLVELEKTCLLARQLFAIGKMPDALAKNHLLGNTPFGEHGVPDAQFSAYFGQSMKGALLGFQLVRGALS